MATRATTKLLSRAITKNSSFQLRPNNNGAPSIISPSRIASAPRLSKSFSRLPVELGSLGTMMMPLHTAIACARLKSVLAAESQSWGLIPQGLAMPL